MPQPLDAPHPEAVRVVPDVEILITRNWIIALFSYIPRIENAGRPVVDVELQVMEVVMFCVKRTMRERPKTLFQCFHTRGVDEGQVISRVVNVGVDDDLGEPKPHEQDVAVGQEGTCKKLQPVLKHICPTQPQVCLS